MSSSRFLFLALFFPALAAFSQDHQHHTSMPADTAVSAASADGALLGSVPMSMEGSGTGWIPERSPMHMLMSKTGAWTSALHGSVFVRYTKQGGPRGDAAWSSPNWLMGSLHRSVDGDHQFMIRAMISLDRLTEGGDGYPLLLQSGETWMGSRLVDYQHPHDVFSELSAAWSTRLSEKTSVFVYAAYPGEPALGPAAFMHRPSAAMLPDAPLSHHWQDATHIAFGVATLGLVWDRVKVDASLFTGREPDENRFKFDRPRFDSRSARISVNPTQELALQVSGASIRDPEGEGSDVTRWTASALASTAIDASAELTAAFIWGRNVEHHGTTDSYLVEASVTTGGFTLASRAELIGKLREELSITIDPHKIERFGQGTISLARSMNIGADIDLSLGIGVTGYALPTGLRQFYANPWSFQVFLRLAPHGRGAGEGHDMHGLH